MCLKQGKICALNLCEVCINKNRRHKLATKCDHKGMRQLYSKGLCYQCYLRFYYYKNKKKRNLGK